MVVGSVVSESAAVIGVSERGCVCLAVVGDVSLD